ncbi:restriction endonuclease S subunits-like protein [Acinetobacter baumannii]|uniref:restriction endonuclease subunit S n=1 Tax=Acinetobacter baumannii TaxID=470 RepID=UPI000DE6ECDC|nr:restriction endonuclease subunit S [Acinetobacter baumannii]SSR72696.1 restriction endonuclease S subunits-like protein [Acinetobacter baumannii]
MAAPKLRFKEFNDNWLKVDIQSLVDEKIIDKPMDGNHGEIHPTSADYVEDGIPFVMATDVIDGKVYLDKSKKIKKSQADGLRKGFSLEGDILLTHKATIGNVAKVPELKTPYIMLTPQVTYYRVLNKDKLNQDFIKSTFEAPVFQNALLALCTGATRLYIGISEQRKLPFSYPSKKEQTKIASFLSAVDEKISQLTQKHELLSQYKQGMMQKLFSQQLRFKADDGSEFGEWENTVIGDIADIVGGGTPSTNNEAYWSGDVVWLTPSEINQKFIGESKRTISELGVQKSSAKKLPIGTILFTSRATIGEVAIAIAEVTTNQGFQSFISNEKTFNEFLYYWIVNNKKSFIERASGSTFLEISKSKIQPMEISLPCLEEQTKIANFLSAIDQKIEVVAQQIEQAKKWKKGLLQQMFV